MEVHAHSHTPRKKWTHYFWEFLMLFLAVFCGFMAENQREHMIEHQREKVYAINLYNELKKDTVQLNQLIILHNKLSRKLDTFCLYSKEKIKQDVTIGMLYYYASYATSVAYYSSQNSTLEQLKGSGNLRLMNTSIAHGISEYDKMIRGLEKEYDLSRSEFEKIEDLHFKLFDVYTMYTILTLPDRKERDSVLRLTDLPIKNNKDLMDEYIGRINFQSQIYSYQVITFLSPIRLKAVELLNSLKTNYRLK